MNSKSLIFSLAFLCLFVPSLSAWDKGVDITRIGEMSSIKGHSLSVLTTSNRRENAFLRFSATLDTYGILSHKTSSFGGKLSATHNTIFKNGSFDEDVRYILYVGAGGVAGYLKDYYRESIRNHGVIFGVTASAGGIVAFRRSHVELGIDFSSDLALQLRRMEEATDARLGLSWYANGIFGALIPQIAIYYRF